MRRWNGWGDDKVHMELPPKGRDLLQNLLGPGRAQPDYPLPEFLKRVPASRLGHHDLICSDPKLRLDHAHGQSLPDWIGLRGGTLQRFPDGVAQPATIEDVQELLQFAAANDVIVIPFGGGTSVVGHLEIPGGRRPVLSLCLQRLKRLVALEPDNLLATFEAGICGPELEKTLNARGFTLGHFPQSFEYSSLGGWVATRSTGQQSAHYGRIEQLFAGGQVLTPRGRLKLPPFPASAAGPDLRHLLLGCEGRMGVLTTVAVRISRLPEKDEIEAVFFPSWEPAVQAVQRLAASRTPFSMVRLGNSKETMANLAMAGHAGQIAWLQRYLKLRRIRPPEACLALLGFTGPHRRVRPARCETLHILRQHGGVSVGQAIGKTWEKNRFRSAYLRNSLWDLGYAVDTFETAVTWDRVTRTMSAVETALETALESRNEKVFAFSHLSHVYPTGSSIYTTAVFRLGQSPAETFQCWKALKQAASRAIVKAGGTISHQHGVGMDHRPYLAAEKGPLGLSTLQAVFSHLDPQQHMNPGKLLPQKKGNAP